MFMPELRVIVEITLVSAEHLSSAPRQNPDGSNHFRDQQRLFQERRNGHCEHPQVVTLPKSRRSQSGSAALPCLQGLALPATCKSPSRDYHVSCDNNKQATSNKQQTLEPLSISFSRVRAGKLEAHPVKPEATPTVAAVSSPCGPPTADRTASAGGLRFLKRNARLSPPRGH